MSNSDIRSNRSSEEHFPFYHHEHNHHHYNSIDEAFIRQTVKKYAYINQRITVIENRLMTILIERNIQLQNAKTNENIKLMRTFSTTVINSLDTLTELNGKLTTILSNCTTDNSRDNLCDISADEHYDNIVEKIIKFGWNYMCDKWILYKNLDIVLWLILLLFVLFIFN